MPPKNTTEEIVVAAYGIPAEIKERIERTAKEQDLNASQFVRRILREYFESVDAAIEDAQAEAARA